MEPKPEGKAAGRCGQGVPGRWTNSQAPRLALQPGGRISITSCLCVVNEECEACGPGEEGHGDLGRGGGGYPAEGLGGMAGGAIRLNVTGVSLLAGGIPANGGAGTGEGRGGKGCCARGQAHSGGTCKLSPPSGRIAH